MDHSCLFFGGYKIAEVVLTSASLLLHIYDMTCEDALPMGHVWSLAFGFGSASSVCLMVAVLVVGYNTSLYKWNTAVVVLNTFFSVGYLVIALAVMYIMNHDEHLEEIPDEEEPEYPLFQRSVVQSLLDMIISLVYLVEAVVGADTVLQARRYAALAAEGAELGTAASPSTVELERNEAMEFSCWPCSVPRWCREAREDCASCWRVLRFKFGRWRRRRKRRRRPSQSSPSTSFGREQTPGPSSRTPEANKKTPSKK